jgi:cytoskeleton protein RodZ
MPEDSKTAKQKQADLGQVGPQLKARRQALRLSLAQVEIDTKIRGKFLTALESGDYSSLPNDIYSRGFVQHYANHLGLSGAEVAAAYTQERGGIAKAETRRPALQKPKPIVFTGRIATVLGMLLLVVGVLGYLLWQFSALAAPPLLTLTTPAADEKLDGGVINIQGQTTPGAEVDVNDSPVLTDTDGKFSEPVALQDGVNVIKITSKSKLGKVTTVTRNVLATLPGVDAAQAVVPDKPIPGVDVAVSVKEATSVVVTVDGKEAWRGIVVGGWSKTFNGTNDVSITTGNAGATSVTVTNSVAAGKRISPLGREGEIRTNQDFNKATVIP